MKKGQIEIMGLVIIVILLVFIAIFALSFSIKPKQENEDILKLKANALRSSLLKTDLCAGINVKDELENCINGYPECLECSDLENEIRDIIESSLEGERYSFIVLSIDGSSFIGFGDCINKITAVSQNLRNGRVEVALCQR